MTLSELTYEAGELGNDSVKQESNWTRFVNRAVQQISEYKSWSFLHDRRRFTILTGDHSVSLGREFKCLSNEQSPISVTYASGGTTYDLPVNVISRALSEQTLYWPSINQIVGGPPIPGGYIPIRVVYLERDGGGDWRLFIPSPFIVVPDAPYNVSGFWHPAPMKLGTDHNPITDDRNLCEAVINYACARSWFSTDKTSKQGDAAMALYEESLMKADYADDWNRYSGIVLRM